MSALCQQRKSRLWFEMKEAANGGSLIFGVLKDIIRNPIRGFSFNPIERFVLISKARDDLGFFSAPINMDAPTNAH